MQRLPIIIEIYRYSSGMNILKIFHLCTILWVQECWCSERFVNTFWIWNCILCSKINCNFSRHYYFLFCLCIITLKCKDIWNNKKSLKLVHIKIHSNQIPFTNPCYQALLGNSIWCVYIQYLHKGTFFLTGLEADRIIGGGGETMFASGEDDKLSKRWVFQTSSVTELYKLAAISIEVMNSPNFEKITSKVSTNYVTTN